MGEEVFAQIGDDALAHLLQNDRLKIGAAHGEDEHACVDGHGGKEAVQGEIAHHHLLDVAHDEGGRDVVGDGEEHQHAHQRKLAAVGLGVLHQTADDLAVRHIPLKAHGFFFVLDGSVGKDQQSGDDADDSAHQQQRIHILHALSPPTSSSRRCRSTILRYSSQEA